MVNKYQSQDAAGSPEQPGASPPPLPKTCAWPNIFDCLAAGSLLLFFCVMSWTHGANTFGRYALFRGGTVSGSILVMVTIAAVVAIILGFVLLYIRLKHLRYCAFYFPKPKKKKGPSVWADMKDALDQLLGLKPYEGLDKEAAKSAVAKERRFSDWLRHYHTRLGFSTLLLFILMYLTPGFIIYVMGQHVLMYYLLEFVAIFSTFIMFLVAWVDLGE